MTFVQKLTSYNRFNLILTSSLIYWSVFPFYVQNPSHEQEAVNCLLFGSEYTVCTSGGW